MGMKLRTSPMEPPRERTIAVEGPLEHGGTGPAYAGGVVHHHGMLLVVEVAVVPARSLLVTPGPQTEVAQERPHGDEEELGVVAVYSTEVGLLGEGIGREIGNEEVADVLNALWSSGSSGSGLKLGHERLGDQRHTPVVLHQFKIGPCAIGLHRSILILEELASATLQGGVDVGQIVITVVDHGVEVAHTVVLVGLLQVEGGQAFQVGRSTGGGCDQVAAGLAQKHQTVGNELHTVDDTKHAIDRVCRMV